MNQRPAGERRIAHRRVLTRDTTRTLARLRRILEASKLINSTLDLRELTSIILRIVRDEIGMDRGTVFVLEHNPWQLRSVVAQDVEDRELVVPLGRGIAGTVALTAQTIDLRDAYRDPRFDPTYDGVLGYRTHDIYCIPIVNRVGHVVGVLELLNRSRHLTEDDEAFLAAMSVHVGLAVENARLHRELLEKHRLERELIVARNIQRHFYPNVPDTYAGVAISASCEMCEQVGGDYLDYFPIEPERFLVALGDVSGKGIGASLLSSSLHVTCRALVRYVHAIEQITRVLNDTFVETTAENVFVTMLVLLIDTPGRRAHLIRAGHNPPLLVSPDGDATLLQNRGGPPLGIWSDVTYERDICSLEPGAVLVLYTDGVTEAENSSGEQFGIDRLTAVVSQSRSCSASRIRADIRAALTEFLGTESTRDDATLFILKFN